MTLIFDMKKKEVLVVIDGNALLHRAWHALPPLTTKDGVVVNAVYGFLLILFRVIRELRPTHIVAAFDRAEKTFRHDEYEAYKAGREKQPDELYEQIPYIYKVLKALKVPTFDKAGYEADDIIGTLVSHRAVREREMQCLILTGDLDALQLVDDSTRVYTMRKGISDTVIYDIAKVMERYGLKPEQLIDFKALKGDPSDNIPGVPGIGEKTAIKLISHFGSLAALYEAVERDESSVLSVIKPRFLELLKKHKDEAFLARKLVSMDRGVPLDFDIEACRFGDFDKKALVDLFSEYQFLTLMDKIPSSLSEPETKKPSIKNVIAQGDLFVHIDHTQKKDEAPIRVISDEKDLKAIISSIKKEGKMFFEISASGIPDFLAEVSGMTLRVSDESVMIKKERMTFFGEIFYDQDILKVSHDMKRQMAFLDGSKIMPCKPYFDTMIASYLLNPGSRNHTLKSLGLSLTKRDIMEAETIFEDVSDEKERMAAGAERVLVISQIFSVLSADLKEKKLYDFFQNLEIPLIPVLFSMEKRGIMLDVQVLEMLRKKAEERLAEVEKKIHEMAGQDFNIHSPQQLKEVLFDRLKISDKGIKKIKTGLSTAASELDKLQGRHPIIEPIFEARELAKLLSTYIIALPRLINPVTHRVHTSFNQTVAATGRLSSSNPNLQNIPIRTALGREVRKAFCARPGYRVLSADYSQIELRIVASISQDQNMMEVYEKGGDIHVTTAAKIFGVAAGEVTKEMRSNAKEVNFGVIYGMGATSLAQRTGIARQEAQQFIKKYFELYSRVALYMEAAKEFAHQHKYIKTEMGRIRYLPEIDSGVPMIRAAAERMAINMPIQGLNADIIKMAMIAIHEYQMGMKHSEGIEKDDFFMLLQVHDELVFEVREDKILPVAALMKHIMENVYKLRVPLIVEPKVGKNWGDLAMIRL